MLPVWPGHQHSKSPLGGAGPGLPEQGMEEGRKREEELEQPALVGVLSQVRGVLRSSTGYTQDVKARGPCLSWLSPVTTWPLCIPAATSISSEIPHLRSQVTSEGRLSTLQGDMVCSLLPLPPPPAPPGSIESHPTAPQVCSS